MAQWNPQAAHDLMVFAANHGMSPMVGAFEAMVDNWANGLHGHTVANFPFGPYIAEVVGDAHMVRRITFDM